LNFEFILKHIIHLSYLTDYFVKSRILSKYKLVYSIVRVSVFTDD